MSERQLPPSKHELTMNRQINTRIGYFCKGMKEIPTGSTICLFMSLFNFLSENNPKFYHSENSVYEENVPEELITHIVCREKTTYPTLRTAKF